MIIGNGLIAKNFFDKIPEDVLLFASGVSNSNENKPEEFNRERILLEKSLNQSSNRRVVYFSTCSIYDKSKQDSLYVKHKIAMEEIVKKNSPCGYNIFRVSNVVGNGGSPTLLLNYFFNCLVNKQSITVHNRASRNLIDIEDVQRIVLHFLNSSTHINKTINVAYPMSFYIEEILDVFEEVFQISPIKMPVDLGDSFNIEINEIADLFQDVNKSNYLGGIIKKYYHNKIS